MAFIRKVETAYEIQAAKKELDSLLLSHTAYVAVIKLDTLYIGTDDYMGLAWFWNHEYNDYLRPENCTVKKRVAVHDAFVKAGLELKEASTKHLKLIKEQGLK